LDRSAENLLESGSAFDLLLSRNFVTGMTMAFKAKHLPPMLPFPQVWIHDGWIAILIAASGRLGLIREPLVLYRQHGSNVTGGKRSTLSGSFRNWTKAGKRAAYQPQLVMEVERYEQVEERLIRSGDIPAERLECLAGKIAHARIRAALPAARWSRLSPVLKELRAGRYRAFSCRTGGVHPALRDLLN